LTILGTAHLTALELAPPQLVIEAARVGFRSVGFRVHPAMAGGIAYPSVPGTQAHRDLRALLRNEGVVLNEIEFVQLTPTVDVGSMAAMLEAGADLGASSLTVSGDDADQPRLIANFAALCDLGAAFGLRVDIEFMRWRVVGTIRQAAAIVQAAGKDNGAILLDTLHLSRSAGTVADVQAVPVGAIRAVQLSDAPAAQPTTDAATITEAREGRLAPGDGDLPLIAVIQALPRDTALSVEVPSLIESPASRLELAFEATHRVLAEALRTRGP
jgi:sugar phosphate isomerase/epimerase